MAETKNKAETAVEAKKIVPKDVDLNEYVTVRNGFPGTLIYKSSRTGEVFKWEGFGDEQDMELRELRNAKNSNKKFFENNWFMFDEDWIVAFLGVDRMYRNAVKLDKFDELFDKKAAEIKKIVTAMSKGQKRSVAYRARQLITKGAIDSNSLIKTLEECLGVELIER